MTFQKGGRANVPSGRELVVLGATDIGKVRSGNEDCYKILVGKEAPGGVDAIMVVADGMGGHAAGEVASEMAVDGMVRHLTSRPPEDTMPVGDYSRLLGQILSEVNGEVFLAGRNPEHKGMGTTCTVAVLKGNQLHLAHVGDSRAYILRAGELVQITTDHSWVGEQVWSGNLTLEQAANHPYRNVVTRAIGIDNKVEVEILNKSVDPGDTVLLCSDGLHAVVSDYDIAAMLGSKGVKATCDGLIDLANANGGPDNITVVVAQIAGEGTRSTTSSAHRTYETGRRRKRRRASGFLGWVKSMLIRRK